MGTFREAVALKCCDDKFKFEISEVKTKCKRNCKFAAKLTLQKKCLDINLKQDLSESPDVQVWYKSADGTTMESVVLNYNNRRKMFIAKAKLGKRSSDECFIYKASIKGFGGVMKHSGKCEAKDLRITN